MFELMKFNAPNKLIDLMDTTATHKKKLKNQHKQCIIHLHLFYYFVIEVCLYCVLWTVQWIYCHSIFANRLFFFHASLFCCYEQKVHVEHDLKLKITDNFKLNLFMCASVWYTIQRLCNVYVRVCSVLAKMICMLFNAIHYMI